MNLSDYLQLLQMNGGAPSPGGDTSQMQPDQNVPHRTFGGGDPISEGSISAINAARESLLGKKRGIMSIIPGAVQDIGTALLRGSESPIAQQFGNMMQSSQQEEQARMVQNMAVLKHLQEVEEARRIQQFRDNQLDFHRQQLQEQTRHHRASEGLSKHAFERASRQEGKLMEDRIKEETGDNVKALSSMGQNMMLHSTKKIDEYTKYSNAALSGIDTIERMKKIAEDNPEVLNSWKFVVSNLYNKNPGFLQQAAMDMGLTGEEKDALFEMASLAKNLNVESVKSIPNRGLNQMMEREIFNANPNARMSLGALVKGLEKAQETLEHDYKEYSKASDYGREGFLYHPSRRKSNNYPLTPKQHQKLATAGSPSSRDFLKNLTYDELESMENEIKSRSYGEE